MERIRLEREVPIDLVDPYIFINSFNEAAELLIKYEIVLEREGWSDLELKLIASYDSSSLEVWGKRLETDQEFEERKKIEEEKSKLKKIALERRRKQYEKLKKEFD